jgi:hypothetical protein
VTEYRILIVRLPYTLNRSTQAEEACIPLKHKNKLRHITPLIVTIFLIGMQNKRKKMWDEKQETKAPTNMTTGKTSPVKCKEMTTIKEYCKYCTMHHDSAGWKSRTVVALLYGSLQGTLYCGTPSTWHHHEYCSQNKEVEQCRYCCTVDAMVLWYLQYLTAPWVLHWYVDNSM